MTAHAQNTADTDTEPHTACFNVCTGDIGAFPCSTRSLAQWLTFRHSSAEDAPAPNALHSFKAHIADGKILVTADPESTLKKNLARQPKIPASLQPTGSPGVVIVGGGSGAFQTVESLREVRRLSLIICRTR